MPNDQTSEATENDLLEIASGGIHLIGQGTLEELTYIESSSGSSLNNPKSATLHISRCPTSTLRAAKSYRNESREYLTVVQKIDKISCIVQGHNEPNLSILLGENSPFLITFSAAYTCTYVV